jgi:hypothetical protein
VPTRGFVRRALIGLDLLCGAILALTGGIVLNGSRVVPVALMAGLVACVASMAQEGGRAASVDAAWKAAVGTVSVVFLVAGVVVLAGGATAAVVSVLAVVTGGAVWRVRAWRARRPGRRSLRPAPVNGDGEQALTAAAWRSRSQLPVSLLPTSVLGGEWLRTTAALGCRLELPVRQGIIRRRHETLDELERRDPVGFARWLATGMATDSDPAAFVRGGRIMGTDAV